MNPIVWMEAVIMLALLIGIWITAAVAWHYFRIDSGLEQQKRKE